MVKVYISHTRRSGNIPRDHRLHLFGSTVVLLFLIIGGRLFQLQVLGHETYLAQAASEHKVSHELPPERGNIYFQDRISGKLFPAALNKDTYTLFVEPNRITDKARTAEKLAEFLESDNDKSELLKKLELDDPYEPIKSGLDEKTAETILDLKLLGVGMERNPRRYYPDREIAAHITGFLGQDEKGFSGKYGAEGYWNEELAGISGFFAGEKDGLGRVITPVRPDVTPAKDGADIVLTIDRTIQFFVCDKLVEYAKKFDADGGTVIVADPKTGAILAMCSTPSFDPNAYNNVHDAGVFRNPAIFEPYEPGSIFKPITMAAGLDAGVVEPSSTYEDKGVVKIGKYEIQNSDLKTNGVQTMTQVLEKSLNTGVVHVARLLGREAFRKYVTEFGFGSLTGIELASEVDGNVSSLGRRGEIYLATNSFGQGLTVTPIELIAAFSAIANDGKLMKPYIVDEVRLDGRENMQTEPKFVRQVISNRTATLLGSMMTAVVENGHGKRGGVPGYFVAGKTGTAQIPNPAGGYYKDQTIGSFVGFAPTTKPKFVMLTKLVRPKGVQWAESTAAPLFGEIAKFLLNYFEVPPERK